MGLASPSRLHTRCCEFTRREVLPSNLAREKVLNETDNITSGVLKIKRDLRPTQLGVLLASFTVKEEFARVLVICKYPQQNHCVPRSSQGFHTKQSVPQIRKHFRCNQLIAGLFINIFQPRGLNWRGNIAIINNVKNFTQHFTHLNPSFKIPFLKEYFNLNANHASDTCVSINKFSY